MSLAPGIGVPRHTHTREDESYYVISGELEVTVAGESFVLKAGDSLMAPRNIPHEIRNSGDVENHYLLVFSPSGFEEFIMAAALPAPDNSSAPTLRQLQAASEDPSIAVENIHKLAAQYRDKEPLGGFYLVDAKDMNKAMKMAAKISAACFGSIEVRPIMTFAE